MGLEEVVNEILKNADSRASRIIRDAKNQADEIIARANQKVSVLRRNWEEENKKLVDEIKRKETASARLEASKMVMEARKKILEDVMSALLDEVVKLRGKRKEELIKKLADMAKKEIEVYRVYCNRKEEGMIKKHFKNARIKTIECEGGFIAENRDGSVSVDMRYSTLIEKAKREIIKEVGKMLFKNR